MFSEAGTNLSCDYSLNHFTTIYLSPHLRTRCDLFLMHADKLKGQMEIVTDIILLMGYVLSLPGSSQVLIVLLRLDEVSLAVILSVHQAGTRRAAD